MPNQSQMVSLFVGALPPDNPGATTRWLSQSHEHMRIPMGWYDRLPILGTQGATVTGPAQEFSPWYNPTLKRVEALFNISGKQYFTYADSPWGNWATPVGVLGQGSGGEALNAQQCRVYVENGNLYASYLTAGSATSLTMAKAAMPTALGQVPVFAKLGTTLNNGTSVCDSPWLMKVNGTYMYFMQNQTALGLGQYVSLAATSPEDLVANPATLVTKFFTGAGFLTPNGPRTQFAFGRACVFWENGTWILYAHSTSALTFGSDIYRWVSKDPGLYPVNWVKDQQQPLVRRSTLYEIDQVADFVALQMPNDRWWAFYTGLSNNGFGTVNIIATPMLEPTMAFDGNSWAPVSTQSDPFNDIPRKRVDMIGNAFYAAGNREHVWNDQTNNTSGGLTLPAASVLNTAKGCNAGKSGAVSLPVRCSIATDTLNGGNPILSATAVGTTVTLVFARPHGKGTNDKITVTGFTPTAYNINGAAVASVGTTTIAGDTLTYVAGSAPAVSTVIGVAEFGLMPGESASWTVWQATQWVRD